MNFRDQLDPALRVMLEAVPTSAELKRMEGLTIQSPKTLRLRFAAYAPDTSTEKTH